MVQTCFKSWPSADPMRRFKRSTMLWLITRKNSSSTAERRKEAQTTGKPSVGRWISTRLSSLPAGTETKTTPGSSGQDPQKGCLCAESGQQRKEVLAIPGTPYDVTTERLIGPDSPLVMPFRHLDEYRKGVEQILRLYKLHQRGGTDHGKLHTARVLFLALTIIQAGEDQAEPSGTVAAHQRHCFPWTLAEK